MTKKEREQRQEVDSMESRVDSMKSSIAALKSALDECVVAYRAESFSNQTMADALALYRGILKNTVEILGKDAIDTSVAMQLIETAGYGVWRGIMGPKNENNDGNWIPAKSSYKRI